jgi:hypothetical protein
MLFLIEILLTEQPGPPAKLIFRETQSKTFSMNEGCADLQEITSAWPSRITRRR